MKRILRHALCALLAALFVCAAFACGTPETPPAAEAIEPAATAEPAEIALPKAPAREKPDKSNLPNVSALDAYRKDDWIAEWIWTEGCSDDSYVAFRKTFTLDDPDGAVAYISAIDKYELWVNGELTVLDGSLKRGATPADCYFDTVPLTNLNKGENTVALLVAFNGRSGDGSVVPVLKNAEGDEANQAGLLFELHAGGAVIASDASWKVKRHDGYKNRVTGGKDYPRYDQSSMLAERNVYFVAGDDIGAFYAPEYDDSAWAAATPIARPGEIPFGDLYAAPTRVPKFGALTDFANAADYVGKTLTEDTTLTLALPGNIQFSWCIELTAEAGKRLTVYTNTYTDRQNMPNFKDTYVTKDGAQSYENYPWRSGSKLLIEAPAGVTFTRLCYRPSGVDAERAGAFASSDAALDQLWREALNTVAICMRDAFMDCPERERGPYMGDAANQIDAALYGFDQGGLDLIRKTILACVAWTTDSGAIPSRAPSVKPQEIPNQSLLFSTAAYRYLLHSGDAATAEAYYRVFVRYLRLFEMGENGLPQYRAGSWQWNDWGEKIDAELLQTAIYCYALSTARSMADALGIHDDDAFFDERIESIRTNWRAVYTAPEGFRSPDSRYVDDRANAMLVLAGMADARDYDAIADVLTSTYEASPFTEKFLLEALCRMGRTDLALERIRVRYAPMLTDEWDTLWELFNDETGTYNHGWSAAPLYILSAYAAGVRPTAPGWASYEIAPTDALESFSCTVWTPKGSITVEKDGDNLTVTVPFGGGTVILPDGTAETLDAEGTYGFACGK